MTDARPLEAHIDTALGGNERPLYDFLCRVSGLPGTRINQGIVDAFAESCAARGKSVDALLRRMASIHPDEAPGGTVLEFVPVCATAAYGLRAASDPRAEAKLLPILHELADDMRFRVRDAVPPALAAIGARRGEVLLEGVAGWMDGYFHAAAVLLALTRTEWLSQLNDGALVATRLAEAFRLLDDAPRTASRYPGYKALVDAIAVAPRALAARFGVIIFDTLATLAVTKDPHLRELIGKSVSDRALQGRFADDVRRVNAAIAAATPAPRDPSRIVKGMRRRGKRDR